MKKPIGILGGTFDPVHNGHLFIANEIAKELSLATVRLIPCAQPVLNKQATVGTEHRLNMLKLAVQGKPLLNIDTRELDRSTPSYTIETLISLRENFPDTPLCFIMGSDAFQQLPKWHQWEKLLDYAHLVVVPRSNIDLADKPWPAEALAKAGRDVIWDKYEKAISNDSRVLTNHLSGKIFFSHIQPPDISSSLIREKIKSGENVASFLPRLILDYILQQHLYQQ